MRLIRSMTADATASAVLTEVTEAKLRIALFLLATLSFLPFFSLYQTGSINDEGQIALGAFRMWSGQAIYTDFNTHIAPGTYCLTLLMYGILGPTMFATRLLAGLLTGGLALVTYLLARRCLSWRWALAPYLLFVAAGVTQWPILSYHWAGVLTFLLGVLALMRQTEQPSLSTAVVCGASMALCGWTLQSEAAALLLLTGLVALFWRRTLSLRMIGMWTLGCLGVSLLLWGPILAKTTTSQIWQQNVEWALGFNAAQGRSPYSLDNLTSRWTPFLTQLVAADKTWAVVSWALHSGSYLLVWTFGYGLFYPVLLGAAMLALRRCEDSRFQLLVLAQFTIALAWSSRQTLLYLNFLTPIFFILLVWLLHRLGRTGVALTGVLCCVYGVGYFYQWREASTYVYPIVTVRGTLYSDNPSEAGQWSQLFREAARVTPPGSPAFCFPYAMGFYYLSGVRPVGPLASVIPILGEGGDVSQQTAALTDEKVPYIYMFPWSEQTLHAVPLVNKEEFWSLVKQSEEQLLENYEQVTGFPGRALYKRRGTP